MAAARAEARRKAILARGNDRLAKLTTSARGEDAPAFVEDRPASRAASLNSFIGEDPETTLRPRTPTSTTSATETASNRSSTATPDPSKWGQDQQEQFMRALLGAGLAGQAGGLPPNLLQGATDPTASQIPEMPHDPLAMLMAQMAGPQSAAGGSPFGPTTHASAGIPSFPGMNFPGPPIQPSGPPKPKSLVQKLMPLVHLLASFALLLYFIFWAEAGAFAERAGASVLTGSDGKAESQWRRWAELGWRGAENGGWGVQAANFFPAFMALEIVLHSMRIFSGFDSVQPPTLLALVLPHLPSPIPSLVMNGMKYSQMLSAVFDDIAGVVVALGFIVWLTGWIST